MKRFFLAAILATAFATPASAAVLFANDFDGHLSVDAGVGVTSLDNGALEAALSFGDWTGNYFANRSAGDPAAMSVLSLSNLAPHTQVSVGFILGFLESWDSTDGSCCTPDLLDLFIDGNRVATLTAHNALGTVEDFGGGTVTALGVQANGNPYYSDTLVDMSTAPFLTFAHTASTLTLAIQARGAGWQGGDDEGWGIDSLRIEYDGVRPVPEPSSWVLLLGGAGVLGAVARVRQGSRRRGRAGTGSLA